MGRFLRQNILDEENGNRENDEEDENIEDDSTSSTDEEESVSSDIYGSDN